jgi:hypothetical protein
VGLDGLLIRGLIMPGNTARPTAVQCLAGAAALAAASYVAYAGLSWVSYAHATRSRRPEEADSLLDGFMPLYDVVDRHHIAVAAPAAVTLAAAREANLFDSGVARVIFKGREIAMGASPGARPPAGLLAAALSLGWGVLADVRDREVVMGGYTRPWEANVTFHDLLPGEFAAFAQPGYVKIVWTLRADPVGERGSIFRTETRAVATDVDAREKFRKYWALASPGIAWIRRSGLEPIKREAERRNARAAAARVARTGCV